MRSSGTWRRACAPLVTMVTLRLVVTGATALVWSRLVGEGAACDPRGEAALFEGGGVLLAEVSTSIVIGRGAWALTGMLFALAWVGGALVHAWLCVALDPSRTDAPRGAQLARVAHRLPEIVLALGMGALLSGAGLYVSAWAASRALSSLPLETSMHLVRAVAIGALAGAPLVLVAPWIELARVRVVVRDDEPLDAGMAALGDLSRFGVLRAIRGWSFAGLVAMFACLGPATLLALSLAHGTLAGLPLVVLVAVCVALAAIVPAVARARWLLRLVCSLPPAAERSDE